MGIDLSDFVGDTPLRISLVKKRQKEQEKLDRHMLKVAPIQAEIAMYDEMIVAIDKRNRVLNEDDGQLGVEEAIEIANKTEVAESVA